MYNTASNKLESATIETLINRLPDGDLKNEFSRRLIISEPSPQLTNAKDIYSHVEYIANEDRENFVLVIMNNQNELLHVETLHIGTVNSGIISIRDIFQTVLKHNGQSFAVAHNHPSGVPTPSQEDIDITRKINDASDLMGLTFLDHLVVGHDSRYTSIRTIQASIWW